MCGLGGVIWKSGETPPDADQILDTLEGRLVHRGPDETGRMIGAGFAVVHRRLAIVDIAAGQQPMTTEDGLVGVAYNGEIYNHLEVRARLEAAGHRFRTRCDTETLLRAFVEDGPDAFRRFDGMFAGFIWDFRDGANFHLVRDHLGVKPLYVYEDDTRIVFASELRAILALSGLDLTPDPEAFQNYLTYRYATGERTLYRRIRRVEAGCAWRISRRGVFRTRYWDLPQADLPARLSEQDAGERLFELLKDAVRGQMMGEVPIGLTLSGGLDSSAIACLCDALGAHYKSFNIGFPDVNEFEFSHAVAKRFGQEHHVFETTVDEIVRDFDAIVWAMDEPIADAACFPLHILCREIRKHVVVVLSGEGSDELLAGYPQYAGVLAGAPVPQPEQFQRFLDLSWYLPDAGCLLARPVDAARTRVQAGYFLERDLLDGMLRFDLKTWLPENLMMKADKILMSHSLEGRFPFLSVPFVEFALSLPADMKLRDGVGKHLLRRIFEPKLPEAVIRRPKMGFSVPVDQLLLRLRERLFDLIEQARRSDTAEILDLKAVQAAAKAHYAGRGDNGLGLWTVLVLLQWLALADAERPAARAAPPRRSAIPA